MNRSARAARFDLVLTIVGIAALLVAMAWIVGAQLEFNDVIGGNPIPEGLGVVARIPAALFLITAVNGLHNAQKSSADRVGRIAYLVMVAGLVLFAIVLGAFWVAGWLIMHVGAVLFGLAVLRAGVFSRGAGFLLLVGVPAGVVAGLIVQQVFFAGTSPWGVFVGTPVMAVALGWLAADAVRSAGDAEGRQDGAPAA